MNRDPGLEPGLRRAAVAPELAAEFPHLGLVWMELQARSGRSPEHVRERLRGLADRYTGGKAVHLRQEPIPWAYRVFFRQVGIDPDDRRTPPEAIALERMRAGGFRSVSLLDDAITIATVETGVALVAFDAEQVRGELELRLSRDRERLGGDGRALSARQLVITDRERPLGVLFADLAENCGVHPRTNRMAIAAVRVKGIPEVSLEEALWTVRSVLEQGG